MAIKDTKARYFAFILYPESLPADWQDKLEKLDVAMAISPLHDKDKKEVRKEELSEDELAVLNNGGSLFKKAHYHVLYVAKNPVTVESIRKKIKRCLGNKTVSHIEIVDGVKSYFDYLTHESKDAIKKHKHKYNKADLIFINDFDIDRYITVDEAEKNDIADLLIDLILEFRIENMFQLERFIQENREVYNLPNNRILRMVIKSNTGVLRMYFDGAYQEAEKERKVQEAKNEK